MEKFKDLSKPVSANITQTCPNHPPPPKKKKKKIAQGFVHARSTDTRTALDENLSRKYNIHFDLSSIDRTLYC